MNRRITSSCRDSSENTAALIRLLTNHFKILKETLVSGKAEIKSIPGLQYELEIKKTDMFIQIRQVLK